jgi:hypothetical protein
VRDMLQRCNCRGDRVRGQGGRGIAFSREDHLLCLPDSARRYLLGYAMAAVMNDTFRVITTARDPSRAMMLTRLGTETQPLVSPFPRRLSRQRR